MTLRGETEKAIDTYRDYPMNVLADAILKALESKLPKRSKERNHIGMSNPWSVGFNDCLKQIKEMLK